MRENERMNWRLFGLNHSFKEYMEKHQDKTMIGLSWALYCRLFAFIFALEILFLFAMLLISLIVSLLH